MLCRIFQKSGLGPPNADRYAPFVEEEWEDDVTVFVPGGETEDDMANGDGSCEKNDNVQVYMPSLTCVTVYVLTSLPFVIMVVVNSIC